MFLLVSSGSPVIHNTVPTHGRSFKMYWTEIPLPFQNGIIIGYSILYQLTSKVANSSDENVKFYNTSTDLSLKPPPRMIELTGLELKSNYSLRIAGITSKGIGIYSLCYQGETGDFSKLLDPS